MKKPPRAVSPETEQAQATRYRSGAVARMLRMPVATLRVWERRYRLTQAALSPSGQRLYAAHDVQRLALLKQLTDLGHAIGSLAALDMVALQRVASTHAQALATTQKALPGEPSPEVPMHPWRVAVIGPALGARLRRPTVLRRLTRPIVWLGPFDDAVQAAATLKPSDVDAVLMQTTHLQPDGLLALDASAPAWAALPKAWLYGFASEAVCEALAASGAALLREPQPDVVLAQWLSALATAAAPPRKPAAPQPVPPRRWNDEALVDFAGLSSTIACECPRHVAELLMQLSHFEAYCEDCESRSPADAELHAYLNRVAASCRSQFEQALEHLALREGLLLPSTRAAAVTTTRPRRRR